MTEQRSSKTNGNRSVPPADKSGAGSPGAIKISLDQLFDSAPQDERAFFFRHIGPRRSEVKEMLALLGLKSLEELAAKIIPAEIRTDKALDLDPALREDEVLGTAPNGSVLVAVRDRGVFFDPRSRLDWWHGF